jgi:hypothetical protein
MTARRTHSMDRPMQSVTSDDALRAVAAAGLAGGFVERRSGGDRRNRLWFSLVYGGVWPRRLAGRRAEDHRPVIDWHGPGLLTSCLLILLLCAADAFLTLLLIAQGATEANPVMALWVYHDVQAFTIVKMALTGGGILALVAIARFRVFRWVRVASFVHALLVGYVALICYELWLLAQIGLD